MSRISQIHNDYLDPDTHLWPTEEWGEEISRVLEALAAWDSGRWHYAPVSAGRGICLTGKDSDLERSGQQGIEVLGANEDGVRIKLPDTVRMMFEVMDLLGCLPRAIRARVCPA